MRKNQACNRKESQPSYRKFDYKFKFWHAEEHFASVNDDTEFIGSLFLCKFCSL